MEIDYIRKEVLQYPVPRSEGRAAQYTPEKRTWYLVLGTWYLVLLRVSSWALLYAFYYRYNYDGKSNGWGVSMATTQVILYFDSPADALRFTLAASSALAGDAKKPSDLPDLSREIKRATRIRAEGVTVAGSR